MPSWKKTFGYVLRWIIYFTAHYGKSPSPLRVVLGYGKDEPWEKRSNTKQDAFNKEANARAEVFLSETFCPAVKAGLSQEIGCEANVYIDEKDKQTVIFAYPHLFTNTATLQVIRLEIGALAAWTPAKTAQIEPYAAEYYPKIYSLSL